MVKGLDPIGYEKMWSNWPCSAARREGFRHLPSTCEGVTKKMESRLLMEMHVRRTKYNGHKF